MCVRFHGKRPAHVIVVMDLEERGSGINKIGQINHLCSYSGELHKYEVMPRWQAGRTQLALLGLELRKSTGQELCPLSTCSWQPIQT